MDQEKAVDAAPGYTSSDPESNRDLDFNGDNQLQRHLTYGHIQLIAIGGAIGTGLFVSIGTGLSTGGPGSLLIGYMMEAVFVALTTNALAEMTLYMPISGSFIRYAGHWVDEAWGFMIGWNFFLYEAILIPFEISALCSVLGYWSDKIPAAAICAGCIVLYAFLNVVAVKFFGEAEFYLSSGKVLLFFIFFFYTIVTMCGGNPSGWAYGFYYWESPGAFAEYIGTGGVGKLTGFLSGGLNSAIFTVVGPEYLSMVAGESQRPRTYLKDGFKSVFWRFGLFFIGGALTTGIVVSYENDMLGAHASAAGSPYVISMTNLGITILPDIANALICTSIFSAGNAYVYCASRCLHGLASAGHAPAVFRKTMRNGIPIYAFGVVMLFPFLSFLQVSSSSASVISILQSMTSGSGLITYLGVNVTFIFFHRATKAQGFDRKKLPYYGYFQPYGSYIAAVWMFCMLIIFGYTTLIPGYWDATTFFSAYLMLFIAVITFSFWKIFKKTKFVKPDEADLVWEAPAVDAYEASLEELEPNKLTLAAKKVFRMKS